MISCHALWISHRPYSAHTSPRLTKDGGPRDLAIDHRSDNLGDHALGVPTRLLSVELITGEDDHVGLFFVQHLVYKVDRVCIPDAGGFQRVSAFPVSYREVQVGDLHDLEFAVLAESWWSRERSHCDKTLSMSSDTDSAMANRLHIELTWIPSPNDDIDHLPLASLAFDDRPILDPLETPERSAFTKEDVDLGDDLVKVFLFYS